MTKTDDTEQTEQGTVDDETLDTVICGDNCEVMRQWPDECIDLVVTSPPYDDLRTYGGHEWDFYGVAWNLSRTEMPFPDESFHLVVFDPPHFDTLNDNARTAKLYGRLFGDWRCEIQSGFEEAFRVLKPFGTLIFKWNSTCIPVDEIIQLSGKTPLFGHKTGRQSKTHWMAFLKA